MSANSFGSMSDLQARMQRASRLFSSQDFRAVEFECLSILQISPKNFDARHLLAIARGQVGDCIQALRDFRAALELNPQSHEVFKNRGLLLQKVCLYEEALSSFDQALHLKPDYFDALFNRGLVLEALNRCDEALVTYDKLIALVGSGSARSEICIRRAATLKSMGKLDECIAAYDEILSTSPTSTVAIFNKGNTLFAKGAFSQALSCYDAALSVRPGDVEALASKADTLAALGRQEEALGVYAAVLGVDSYHLRALQNCGAVLYGLRRYEEALAMIDKALEVDPNFVSAWHSRALVLKAVNRSAEVIDCYRRLAQLQPDSITALTELGSSLRQFGSVDEGKWYLEKAVESSGQDLVHKMDRAGALGALERYEEAISIYEGVISVDPENISAWVNRGISQSGLGRFQESLESFKRALQIDPRHADALNGMGIVLSSIERYDESRTRFDEALASAPDSPPIRVNRSFCLLRCGDFQAGLRDYEWRQQLPEYQLRFVGPGAVIKPVLERSVRWRGQKIAGKTILVFHEQGIGDTLHFCRYIYLLADAGARVVLEVPRSLKSLFARNFTFATVFSIGEGLPQCDYHCPFPSLPLAFGTRLESIPNRVPYLCPDQKLVEYWKSWLAGGKARVGLAWSGSTIHKNDRNRSIAAALFEPVLKLDAQFVCLQTEIRASDLEYLRLNSGINCFSDRIRDFDDTAALIAGLDLVITVDTSIAHMAGAMGVPTWILISKECDWRWLIERSNSPWYPSVKLHRQKSFGDWRSVMSEVANSAGRCLAHCSDGMHDGYARDVDGAERLAFLNKR